MNRAAWIVLIAVVLSFAPPGFSKVSEEEAARLGTNLTPVGANPAANADGTIPPWTGGVTTPSPEWKDGGPRIDLFAADEVLYSIDKSNLDTYRGKLSPGQIALIEKHDGYRMDIYPTRRSCGYPDWVYETTRKNATRAKLDDDRIYLVDGWHPFLFPIPKDGAEAIWNHTYSFVSKGWIENNAVVAPTTSGDMTVSNMRLTADLLMFNPSVKDADEAKGRSALTVVERFSPARLAGQVVLVHEMVNDQRRAWIYNPGQRRVRRAPTVAYDNPLAGTEGLMTTDQSRMFTGIIDRYDWKLVGKRELYVPYNVFDINHGKGPGGKDLEYEKILGGRYPQRDLIRYELHRVWVVEATVRKGKRHLYDKRVFYLDEDTWLAVEQDMYDKGGNLWRVQEGLLTHLPEVPTCAYQGTLSYDLVAGRYVADGLKTEETPDDFLAGEKGRIPAENFFTPDALRRMGRR
jgi:hypothetical protein